MDDLAIIIQALRNTSYNRTADEIERLLKIRGEREAETNEQLADEAARLQIIG